MTTVSSAETLPVGVPAAPVAVKARLVGDTLNLPTLEPVTSITRVPTGVLSAIVTVAADEAPGFGVNVTLIVQLAPGAIPVAAVVQFSVMAYCAAAAPPRVTPLTVTGPAGAAAVPVLVLV